MDLFTIYIIWCCIGAGSTIILIPLIGDDFPLIWHMFTNHDIVSKIVVGSKFVCMFLLFSIGGLLTTIFLGVIYFKQRNDQ